MPNTCHTIIEIDADNAEELRDFIIGWADSEYRENGFNGRWLGNIIGNSGIGDPTDIFCRGVLESVDVRLWGTMLEISTRTQHDPAILMWVKLAEKYCPGAEVRFTGDDGCEWYYSNDELVKGRYHLRYEMNYDYAGELCDDDEDDFDEEEIVKILQDALETDETDIRKLISEAEDSEAFDEFMIAEWEYLPIENCR